jgi:hypothetical protein
MREDALRSDFCSVNTTTAETGANRPVDGDLIFGLVPTTCLRPPLAILNVTVRIGLAAPQSA